MRYCFVLPHFDEQKNSFSKLLAPLARELLASCHSVSIVSAHSAYQGEFASVHTGLNLRYARPAFINVLAFVTLTTLWLWRRRKNFDVVHNLGVGSTLRQDVLTAHACHRAWVAVKWQKRQFLSLFLNPQHAITLAIEAWNYRQKIPVIAVCQSLANEIIRYYPHTKERITVIPNGVDEPLEISALPRIDKARPGFILSFASNDHRKKGLYEIIDALELAHQAGRPWYLEVLGVDPRQKLWEDYAAVRNLSEWVVFRGHVDAIRNHFAASDVFCLPSHYEPFGLVYLEAAQAGCAIVSTAVGVAPDLFGDYQDVRLRPLPLPLEVKALYEQLCLLDGDPGLRADLGSHVEAQAKRFSARAMVLDQIRFYQNTFGRR